MELRRMLISIPFFREGSVYAFDHEDERVYRVENGKVYDNPLRYELSDYLWIIKDEYTEPFRT